MSANRSLARNVAKVRAKKAGMTRICSKGKKDGKWDGIVNKHSSWFSIHWRSLVKKG